MDYSSAKHVLYNHMVGRTASVISPFYSLLPDADPPKKALHGENRF